MMMDPVIAKLIEDVIDLKAANRVNLPQIEARLQRLEAVAEQARVDKEQAERREMAELRQRLAAAEAKAG